MIVYRSECRELSTAKNLQAECAECHKYTEINVYACLFHVYVRFVELYGQPEIVQHIASERYVGGEWKRERERGSRGGGGEGSGGKQSRQWQKV